MKRILFSILVLVCAMGVKAQDMMVATLQSGEESKVFYGADSFVEAYNAAQTGDLITLSPGTFNVPTITKSLKIQGAGYIDDPDNGSYRTILNYKLKINLSEGNTDDFLLEGVYSHVDLEVTGTATINRFVVKRCRFGNISFSGSTTKGSRLEHCRIANELRVGTRAENFSVMNSVVVNLNGNTRGSSIRYQNTIIHRYLNTLTYSLIADFENCIFNTSSSESNCLHENCLVKNCLSSYGSIFDDVLTKENAWTVNGKTEIWGSDKGYSDTDLYELTDDAKSKYVGTDGKEIGIHGGDVPFTFTPSHPQITKRDIATKTSGGKLKVEITVEAQEN